MSKLTPIEIAALRIAIWPPVRKSKWSPSCYVRWGLVELLREEFEKAGVDWKRIHKMARDEAELERQSRKTESTGEAKHD